MPHGGMWITAGSLWWFLDGRWRKACVRAIQLSVDVLSDERCLGPDVVDQTRLAGPTQAHATRVRIRHKLYAKEVGRGA